MTSPLIARAELLDADPLSATGRPVRWGVGATGAIAATVTADLALLPVHRPTRLDVEVSKGEVRTEEFELIGSGYVHELREVTRCLQEGLSESAVMPLAHSLAMMQLLDGVRQQLGVGYAADQAPG